MSNTGRRVRERRLLFPKSNLGLIVPIDHGLTAGPIAGIDTAKALRALVNDIDCSAVLLHKGVLEFLVDQDLLPSRVGVIVHLNGMPTLAHDANDKHIVTTIEAAARLGADGVSLQTNFSPTNFAHNLELLGRAIDTAHEHGLPVLTMLYDGTAAQNIETLNKLVRVTVELGTDLLKIGIPAKTEDLESLMSKFHGNTKVFFAGGAADVSGQFFESVERVLQHGAHGLCVGRNVFQAEEPHRVLQRLARMIRSKAESSRRAAPGAVQPQARSEEVAA